MARDRCVSCNKVIDIDTCAECLGVDPVEQSRRAAAWDALWEWHKDATAQVQEKGEAFFVPAWAFLEKATDLLAELEAPNADHP